MVVGACMIEMEERKWKLQLLFIKINIAADDEGIQEEEVIVELVFADAVIADAEREQKRRRVAAAANAYLPTACFISV